MAQKKAGVDTLQMILGLIGKKVSKNSEVTKLVDEAIIKTKKGDQMAAKIRPQLDALGLPMLTKRMGRPLGSRDRKGLVRKNKRPAKPKKVKLKNVTATDIDKIEKPDPNIGERFFKLSLVEIFQKTLTWRDLEILGVNKRNVVALMIFGDSLVMDKQMPIARLRHFECTEEQLKSECKDYEIRDVFMSTGALKLALGEDRAKAIYHNKKGTEKVHITREALRSVGADLSDMVRFIEFFAIKEKIRLSLNDLAKLGFVLKNQSEMEEKVVTITLVPGYMFKYCVQAKRCRMNTRCAAFAQEQMIDGLQCFSCQKCPLFEIENKLSVEQEESQVDVVSRNNI